MKKYLAAVVVIILIVVFIAWNNKGPGVEDNKVTFGWFGPLSGPVASVGEQNLRGIQLAIKDYGKGNIKLDIEDDQFNAKNSISAYEKLKTEKVFIMLSPTYSGLMALAPRADTDKVLIADSLDSSSEIANAGEYLLGLGYYADGHGANFAQKIEASGAKKVAVLYNQSTLPQLIVNAFKKLLFK